MFTHLGRGLCRGWVWRVSSLVRPTGDAQLTCWQSLVTRSLVTRSLVTLSRSLVTLSRCHVVSSRCRVVSSLRSRALAYLGDLRAPAPSGNPAEPGVWSMAPGSIPGGCKLASLFGLFDWNMNWGGVERPKSKKRCFLRCGPRSEYF